MKLIKGDCLEKMKGIPDKSVDLIICDLPYGMTDCKWDSVLDFDSLWNQYRRILKPFGVCILFGAEPFMSQVITSNPKEYSHQWYWKKSGKTGGLFAHRQPMRCVEEMAVFICNTKDQRLRSHTPTYNPQGVTELEKPRYKKETGGAIKFMDKLHQKSTSKRRPDIRAIYWKSQGIKRLRTQRKSQLSC